MSSIWFKDPINFFDINNMLIFLPTTDMVYTEKLNAVMRLVLYICIILYAIQNDVKVFMLVMIVGVIIYILYNVEEDREKYMNEYKSVDKYDENEYEDRQEECTKPSKENPFMNVMMDEYTKNPQRKKACKMTKQIDNYIDEYFNDGLYKSIDDIYNKNSSERQYYTMPSTEIPNDQDNFARWLYRDEEKTCKEGNLLKCKYFS